MPLLASIPQFAAGVSSFPAAPAVRSGLSPPLARRSPRRSAPPAGLAAFHGFYEIAPVLHRGSGGMP